MLFRSNALLKTEYPSYISFVRKRDPPLHFFNKQKESILLLHAILLPLSSRLSRLIFISKYTDSFHTKQQEWWVGVFKVWLSMCSTFGRSYFSTFLRQQTQNQRWCELVTSNATFRNFCFTSEAKTTPTASFIHIVEPHSGEETERPPV